MPHSLTIKFFNATVLLLLLQGCVTTTPTIKSKEGVKTTFSDFVNGEVVLPQGSPNSLLVLRTPFRLMKDAKYIASVLYILEMMPENNLVYHTLGYNAEQLGLFESALIYYEKSKESSWSNTFCGWGQKSSFPYYCADFDPQSSIERIKVKLKTNNDSETLSLLSDTSYQNQVKIANYEIEHDKRIFADRRAGLNVSKSYRSTANGNEFEISELFEALVKLAFVVAAVDAILPDSNDSLSTRAMKAGVLCGLSGSKNCGKNNVMSAVPTLQTRTITQPTQVKSITSASAGFSIPQVASTSNANSYSITTPLTAVTPNFKAQQPLRQGKCECSCVNGTVQALCSSTIDIRPICPEKLCPVVIKTVKPLHTPSLPPVGTKSCDLQQVYNEDKRQYEWQEICT
jgi:hypothetical protein